ncbi:serine hydrolase [Haloferacaceae archaeon DSL9]
MSFQLADERTDAIEDLVYDWLAETGAPGASLTIVDRESALYERGFGSRRLSSNEPATPETLYGFASVTKSFTALAVLQCVERGDLSLDDSIAAHTDAAFDGAADVTLHELLTHTSGVPSLATSSILIARQGGLGEAGVPLGSRGDLSYFVDGVGAERDEASIGRFMYNNTAYILLSHAVERATGRPFEIYATEAILRPLGMERSTFDAEVFESDPDRATPYREGDGGLEETSFPARRLSHGPGGLIASASELGNYLRLQLNDGTHDGERLIDAGLLARAHEPQATCLPRYGDRYGYGWATREIAGERLVGHGGSLLTSSAAVGFLPDAGVGIALGCGSQPSLHPTEILEGITAILLDADPRETVPSLAYRDRIERLTGEYESYRGVATATVSDEGGHLAVETAVGPLEADYALVPDDPTLASLSFTVPAPGRPTPAEFVPTDDGVDLFLDRYRFHKC